MWNGPNKTTKDHNYQQFARKDLLRSRYFTLDTSHLLMSELNALALLKAVVFGRKKKKGTCKMWNGPNKTTKDHTINNWQGKTYCGTWLSHLTRPSCWCRRWTRKHHKRLLCLGEGKRQCKMWNRPNKTTRTKNINNWQGKTYYSTCLSHLTRPTCWCRRWTFQRKRRLLRLGGERRKCTCKMWDG